MWVIIEKIEEEMGGWCSCVVKDVFGMGMQKIIRRGWEHYKNGINLVVGGGRRVKFWMTSIEEWWGQVDLERSPGC